MLARFDTRWIALAILCLGDLMIVLDTTIVNVALPSIQADLGFTQASLVWVVNAYMLTFSGFLLLGGRLGDLYGQRRLFLIGLAVFTLASLACGLAQTQAFLIAARAIQGIGGAIVSAIALSLIMNLFTNPAERAKAMGFFGFVMAGGGSVGVFLGGILTGAFDWHWVFLVNIPIGILVFILCLSLFEKRVGQHVRLDVLGAITITASLMLAVYGIVGGNAVGWLAPKTLALLIGALAVFLTFLFIEKRAAAPLVPLDIFKKGNIAVVSVIGILWSAGMFACFFLSALYMQLVLGYDPLRVSLAFLPSNVIMALLSLGLSARLVMRFGVKKNLAVGMALLAVGLFLFTIAPANASLWIHILPGMLLIGLGAGMAFNPVLLAGTADIPQHESGLASGVLNTSFMMGGSLGLAILASVAEFRTESMVAAGASQINALLSGYHLAFFAGALCAVVAAVLTFWLRESSAPSTAHMH